MFYQPQYFSFFYYMTYLMVIDGPVLFDHFYGEIFRHLSISSISNEINPSKTPSSNAKQKLNVVQFHFVVRVFQNWNNNNGIQKNCKNFSKIYYVSARKVIIRFPHFLSLTFINRYHFLCRPNYFFSSNK